MPRLSDAKFVAIDTETTGSDPAVAEVIEIAVRRFSLNSRPQDEDCWSTLVRPEGSVPPAASAVHHLTDEDLADSPSLGEVTPTLLRFVGHLPLIAHNAEYDQTVLTPTGLGNHLWLDTYRLAMHLWAIGDTNEKGFALGSFSQQELRYWLGLPRTDGDAHRAAADIAVTAHLFRAAANLYLERGMPDDAEVFQQWLVSPIVHRTIPFGWGMAGKQPEELAEWQLRRAFDPTNDKFKAMKKFNVHDFLYPSWRLRCGLDTMDAPNTPAAVAPPLPVTPPPPALAFDVAETDAAAPAPRHFRPRGMR